MAATPPDPRQAYLTTPTDPCGRKGKWWEGYDPRLLYGIDLRAYKNVANVKYRPEKGIFQEHLAYAHWYTTRWAMRIMDVIDKYDPDFIYTDGDTTQPFNGEKTGTGTKCDAVERVIADFYNRALANHGAVDKISIVKFHPGTSGVANTFEGRIPKDIQTDQAWIGENAVGDWFYAPNFAYSARALVLYMLEMVSRDGIYAVNMSLRPDGSLDAGSVKLLKEVGEWMKINGEGIYGSKAWVKVRRRRDQCRAASCGHCPRAARTGAGRVPVRPRGFSIHLRQGRLCVCFCAGGATTRSASDDRLAGQQCGSDHRAGAVGEHAGQPGKTGLEPTSGRSDGDCPSKMPSQIAVAFKVQHN